MRRGAFSTDSGERTDFNLVGCPYSDPKSGRIDGPCELVQCL